jgi:hypothetical protein
MFTKRGNTAGFTADGGNVCGSYSKNLGWVVCVNRGYDSLTNGTRKAFPTLAQAEAYARTLICPEATKRLAWW